MEENNFLNELQEKGRIIVYQHSRALKVASFVKANVAHEEWSNYGGAAFKQYSRYFMFDMRRFKFDYYNNCLEVVK